MSESIFPYLQPETTEAAQELPTAQEFAWDFEADMPIFSGGLPAYVERAAAVKVWAWNALRTPRWTYEMFTGDYGSDMQMLVGTGWSDALKTAEAQQYITECLLTSPYMLLGFLNGAPIRYIVKDKFVRFGGVYE